MEIKEIVSTAKAQLDARGGVKKIYFVGCGGSQAAIYSAKYLLETEGKVVPTAIFNSNEFVYATPSMLDERCLVICISLKATAQTVDALRVAKDHGAVTIAMTGHETTLMAQTGEHVIVYSNGDEQIYSQGNQALSVKLVFELLNQFEGYTNYQAAMDGFQYIDQIIAEAKAELLPKAQAFAKEYEKDQVFFVMGSGPLYGTAYSMANCHLMEMQWRYAICLQSDEYFQGPFEMTSPNLAMVLLKSGGRTRYLDERVEKFLSTYAGRHTVIDVNFTNIDRIDASVREFFESIIMIPIERYYVAQLEVLTGHSMDERRYMWKVEY